MNTLQQNVTQHIGSLITLSFKLSNPLSQLNLMREKIIVRGYQSFDKPNIMDELGRLQHIMGEIHAAMLKIHDTLKKEQQ